MQFKLASNIVEQIDKMLAAYIPSKATAMVQGGAVFASRCIECGNNCAWDCVSSCHYTCQSACEKANAHDNTCSYLK